MVVSDRLVPLRLRFDRDLALLQNKLVSDAPHAQLARPPRHRLHRDDLLASLRTRQLEVDVERAFHPWPDSPFNHALCVHHWSHN